MSSKDNIIDSLDIAISDRLIRMQLVNIRKSKGITQQQISDFTGLSRSCIYNIESGHRSSTIDSIIKYATAIGASVSITPLILEDNKD